MRLRRRSTADDAFRFALALFCFCELLVPPSFSQTRQHTVGVAARPADLSAIQHFVFILKENRSYDSYFGTFPGANGATSGKISTGQVIPLNHAPDGMPRNVGYTWSMVLGAMDSGRMDGFDLEVGGTQNGDYLAYSQLYQADIPNYFTYASSFVLGDYAFPSMHGPSFPNHLYAVAGQAGGSIGNLGNTSHWGCDSVPSGTTDVLDSQGILTAQFPCFDFPVLGDALESNGISWAYYTPQDSDWNAMAAINHVFRNPVLYQTRVPPVTQFIPDALAGDLPAVSWVVPPGSFSEHAPNSSCEGENWTVQLINAVMQGPDWGSTLIVLAWDDHGGFYDHVPVPQPDVFGFGPRVPWLIISPFAKPGHVSSTLYEFSSFLKIVEERFGLPPLTARDAAANDMLDSLDFMQTPLPPLVLQTRACSPAYTTNLDFLPQLVGSTSAAKTVGLQNRSTSNMAVNSIVLSGGDFSQTNDCPSILKPQRYCTITATFTPTATALRTGTITIKDSDPTSPQTVTLTGVGTQVTLSPRLLDFGKRIAGTHTRAMTATLHNQSNSELTISNIIAGGDYTQTNTCGTSVPAGGSCTISGVFHPATPGSRYGSVVITDSDLASPHVLNLTGVATSVAVSPARLQFASQALGTTSTPQTFDLMNKGQSSLTIYGVSIVGDLSQPISDYSQSNNCGGQVPPKTACTFTVAFSPIATGARAGFVVINDSEDETSPHLVGLSGKGVANPVPFISQPLLPPSARPGSPGFSLTVSGSGFLPSAVVNWNGSSLPTAFVTTSKVLASVPAANIATAGTAAVTVVNPGPGGGASNVAYFAIANPLSSVSLSSTQLTVGNNPSSVVRGDFNKDGKVDLAVANRGNNTVTILMGNGDGTFAVGSAPGTGRGPVALASEDFNADGQLDLAVANLLDNTVTILFGLGDGTFSPAPAAIATGNAPSSIAAADLNQDGRLDLAVVNSADNTVSIILGLGNATFYEISTPIVGLGASAIAAADFDRDGKLDLATANGTDNTITCLKGKGDGTFTLISTSPTGLDPVSLVAADFDGDGQMDLAVANQSDNTVSFLRGKGTGLFYNHVGFPVSSGPAFVSSGDFDADGKIDLVVTNAGSNTVSLLLGKGNGTFGSSVDFATGTNPTVLAVADLNSDGKMDLAVANQTSNDVSLLLETGVDRP